MKRTTYLATLFAPAAFLCTLAACGDSESNGLPKPTPDGASNSSDAPFYDTLPHPTSDSAAAIDVPMPVGDGAATGGDGGTPDAGSPLPAAGAGCTWKRANMCDTGGTITEFCPTQTVTRLWRCDDSVIALPANYGTYHLCSCAGGQVGSCCEGVSWQAIECCPNP